METEISTGMGCFSQMWQIKWFSLQINFNESPVLYSYHNSFTVYHKYTVKKLRILSTSSKFPSPTLESLSHKMTNASMHGGGSLAKFRKVTGNIVGGNVKQDTLRKQPNPWAMSIEVNLVRHFEMLVCYVSFLSRKCGNVVLGDHVINTSLYHHGNHGPILW